MTRVLVPLATGFEDLEAITITDLLRRAQFDVVTAGLTPGPIQGSRGTVVVPDMSLNDALLQSYDLVVLPGGQPGATHLENDERLQALLKKMAADGKVVAAVCAAPKVLAVAGVLDGKRATGFPGTLSSDQFPDIKISTDAVVTDGNIVTSRGPGTAMDFTLALIDILAGGQVRKQVEQALHRP